MGLFTRSMRMLSGIMLLVLALAACGQQTGTSSGSSTGTNSSGSTPGALSDAAGTSAPAGGVTTGPTSDTATTAVAGTDNGTSVAGGGGTTTANTIVPVETSQSAGATEAATTAASGGTSATSATGGTSATGTTGGTTAGGNGATIRVASKDFTEEFIVGEMYALLLENNGFKVERKINLGGTPIAQQALINNEIDLYPEYTSTGLLEVLKDTKNYSDEQQILNAVKTGYEQQFKLTWLTPSPFNDTNAFAVTQETAQKYNLKTISDMFAHAADLRLGGTAEFPGRTDTAKMEGVYGSKLSTFKEYVQLGTGTLRYDALKSGQIDVVVAFGTDGRIGADNLVVLQDDKKAYPVYQIAPVIRQDVLQANPAVADVLNKLAPLLTDKVMAGLNAKVDVDSQQYEDVAQEFLKQQNLIK